jgi:hypothetical protein
VSQWEHEQITLYPEIGLFIEKLKNMIKNNPESGLLDPVLSVTGKTIPCRKQAVNITLFSNQYAIGYNFITASYIYNEDSIVIIKMGFY